MDASLSLLAGCIVRRMMRPGIRAAFAECVVTSIMKAPRDGGVEIN